MHITDLTIQNKGAANGQINASINHAFTYITADDCCNNLHVFCCDENEAWLGSRDNNTTLNADAATLNNLFNKFNNPLA